jgi:hypothetical protein
MNGSGYYGWGWTGFREIIMEWQRVGFFDVVLPLLLIFAIVYAILDKIKILGENKAVNIIISLALAFFAVSNLYVSAFFMYLFSYTGVAIAILLAAIILLGLFLKGDDDNKWRWILGFGGFILFVWVLSRATSDFGVSFFGPNFSWWLSQNLYWMLILLFIGGAIVAIVVASGGRKKSPLDKLTGR